MMGRAGLGLMLTLLSASCAAPSIDLRQASAPTAASPAGVTIALDDPLPAGPPRLSYRLSSIFSEMLSWSPLRRHAPLAEAGGGALGCLTSAIYYEARSEPADGQRAVAQVVLNRVGKPSFARTVCGVVRQRSSLSGECQFNFVCDGAEKRRREVRAWAIAERFARAALDGTAPNGVGSATFYHSVAVSPGWSRRFERVATIGSHIFYRTRAI